SGPPHWCYRCRAHPACTVCTASQQPRVCHRHRMYRWRTGACAAVQRCGLRLRVKSDEAQALGRASSDSDETRYKSLEIFEDLAHLISGLSWALANLNACCFKRFFLGCSSSGGTGNDRTGVTHGLTFRCGKASNVANNWFGYIVLNVLRSLFFGVATDFTDHDDGLGVWILFESFQRIDVGGADDRVTTNSVSCRGTNLGQFVHHQVGQCTRFGDQTNGAGSGNSSRANARQGHIRCDDARTVWTNDPSLRLAIRTNVGL